MAEVIIHSDNFTDSNGDIHYFNTGRDNVSGISFSDHYINNKDNYLFTRLLYLKLSTDTSLIYPIHECFLLTTYTGNNNRGITNIITVDAIVKRGTIATNDIKVTCTPLNSENKIHGIKAALKQETNAQGFIGNTLGIWLDTNGIFNIAIKDLSSLSYNMIPNNIYNSFLECNYEALYLNNEEVTYDVNMYNFQDSIGVIIAEGINVNQPILDKIKTVDDKPVVQNDYKFLSVIYDDLYSIKEVNVDEVIKPTTFQYNQIDNSFMEINKTGGFIKVLKEGNYLISLKVNMDIHEGSPTNMKAFVFINDYRVDDLTSSVYLDPKNKIYPLGFLAGQIQIQLKPSDKIYLKTRWSNKNNVNIENHCTLQITKLN